MSIILFLESDNGEEVPIHVQPDDDFQAFLSRARGFLGKDLDISTIVGEQNVSLSDNVYQFMLRAALNNDSGNSPSIEHEIIDVTHNESSEDPLHDQYLVAETNHENDNHVVYEVYTNGDIVSDDTSADAENTSCAAINSEKRKEKTESSNDNHTVRTEGQKAKCCFCDIAINNQTFPSYIFDERDQKEMRKNKHRRNRGAAKVVCDVCLQRDFVKVEEMPSTFDKDSFLILRNNTQYFYRRKQILDEDRHKGLTILNKQFEDEDEVTMSCENSYQVVRIEQTQNSASFTCRLCHAMLDWDTSPESHCLDHITTRAGGLVFPCILCEYGFSEFGELKSHINKVHIKSVGIDDVETNPNDSIQNTKGKQSEKGLRLLQELLTKRTFGKMTGNDVNGDVQELDSTLMNDSESDNESGVWIIQAGDVSQEQLVSEDLVSEECEDELGIVSSGDVVTYQCESCSQEFESMKAFSLHECSLNICEVTSVVVQDDQPKEDPKEVKAKVIAVKVEGGGRGPVRDSPESPVRGHHQCSSCDKTFHTKIRLQFHIRYIHSAGSDPATLRCSICPEMVFGSEGALYDHIHFTHPKNKKFACPMEGCTRQFNIKGNLRNHLCSHSGKRAHACDVCDKLFLDKQTLNEHKITHLAIKPFQCHICHKYLNRKSRLRMHLLNHQTQPSCSQILACGCCGAAFSDSSSAQSHLNDLGECGSILDTDASSYQNFNNEQSVDDPDAVFSLNDSGISLDANGCIDQETVKKEELYVLFDDIKEEKYDEKNDENSQNVNGDDNPSADKVLGDLSEDARKTIRMVKLDKVFRCEYCEMVYCVQESLNIHRLQHKDEVNPYSCHICGARFSTYSRCTTHKTTHGFYRSSNKGEPSAKSWVRRDDFPVTKLFSCQVCNKTYLHWTYLQVHRKLKHSDNVHMYKCVTCGDEFPNSWGVAYHRKKVHGQSTGSAPPDEVPDTNIERVQYSCPECGIILATKAQLFLHKRSVHPVQCSPSKADMFACAKCGKRYLTKVGLQGHFRKQHEKSDKQSHKCEECAKVFITLSGLNTHIRRVHMKEVKFQCVECGLGFYSSCDYRSHLRRHSGEKPFPCHLCGKHFRTKGMRNQHVTIHSGERPFKCEQCGVGFRRSYALHSHRLTHAPHTRSLQCPICPRLFRLKAELNTHLRHTHCVDPLLYTIETPSKQTTVQSSDDHTPRLSLMKPIQGFQVKDKSAGKNSSYLFSTVFEPRSDTFMENIGERQGFDENEESRDEQMNCSKNDIEDGELEGLQDDNNTSGNLCIISGQSLENAEIVIDNQYMLDENDEPSKVMEVNGYFTKLVTLNNVEDVSEIKFIKVQSDVVSKQEDQLQLTSDHLNELYGSNVVIDMPIDVNSDKWM